MIPISDVRNTLRAWQPETPEQQVRDYFEQINDLLTIRYEQLEAQLVGKWKAKKGRYPDALTLLQIRRMAQQLAEDQTRGETLDQITAEIAAREADDEEDNPFLEAVKDPDGWRTKWSDIQPAWRYAESVEYVEQFWDDRSPLFQCLAIALLETMQYHGQEWRWEKDTEQFRMMEAKIELAKQQNLANSPRLQEEELRWEAWMAED